MPAGTDIKQVRHAYRFQNRVNRLERLLQVGFPNEVNSGTHGDPRVLVAAVIEHGHPLQLLARQQVNGETLRQTNASRKGVGKQTFRLLGNGLAVGGFELLDVPGAEESVTEKVVRRRLSGGIVDFGLVRDDPDRLGEAEVQHGSRRVKSQSVRIDERERRGFEADLLDGSVCALYLRRLEIGEYNGADRRAQTKQRNRRAERHSHTNPRVHLHLRRPASGRTGRSGRPGRWWPFRTAGPRYRQPPRRGWYC